MCVLVVFLELHLIAIRPALIAVFDCRLVGSSGFFLATFTFRSNTVLHFLCHAVLFYSNF